MQGLGSTARLRRIAAVIRYLPLLLLAACTTQPSKPVIQYSTVEVPRYLHATIPAQYVADRVVVEPKPACGQLYCNGQVAMLLDDYRAALKTSNLDKSALRALDKEP